MSALSCIVNAHNEAHTIYPTLKSVMRAKQYAANCGLQVDIHVILDSSDDVTTNVVSNAMKDAGTVHSVSFGDLALSRNYATDTCKSEFLAFMDGDDLCCKSWFIESYTMLKELGGNLVLHPEYNIYFGSDNNHVFHHVDMEALDFEPAIFFKSNYWTALSFAARELYKKYPYHKNQIDDGFGFEDWTWNFETIANGIIHKTVPGTAHFIRRGKSEESLLDKTNKSKSVPRILDLYTRVN